MTTPTPMQAALDKDVTIEELAREVERLRAFIAEMNNKVRHQLAADIEAATDKAFRRIGELSRAALSGKETS